MKECLSAIDKLPERSCSGAYYRCSDMVNCVNTLRHVNRSTAVQALQQYSQLHQDAVEWKRDEKLIYVCRLSFIAPNGWDRLNLGQFIPEIHKEVAGQFPLFPIAISDGVPFFLINSTWIEGLPSTTGAYDVRKCEKFGLIDHDYPTKGFEKAAQDLIQSELFQKLYKNPDDKEQMTREILSQAQ